MLIYTKLLMKVKSQIKTQKRVFIYFAFLHFCARFTRDVFKADIFHDEE